MTSNSEHESFEKWCSNDEKECHIWFGDAYKAQAFRAWQAAKTAQAEQIKQLQDRIAELETVNEKLEEAVWQVLDDMDCFEYADCGDEVIVKDNSENKNSNCCIAARDQLIEAYQSLKQMMGGE